MTKPSLPDRAARLLALLILSPLDEAAVSRQLDQMHKNELQAVWRAADRLGLLATKALRSKTP